MNRFPEITVSLVSLTRIDHIYFHFAVVTQCYCSIDPGKKEIDLVAKAKKKGLGKIL